MVTCEWLGWDSFGIVTKAMLGPFMDLIVKLPWHWCHLCEQKCDLMFHHDCIRSCERDFVVVVVVVVAVVAAAAWNTFSQEWHHQFLSRSSKHRFCGALFLYLASLMDRGSRKFSLHLGWGSQRSQISNFRKQGKKWSLPTSGFTGKISV